MLFNSLILDEEKAVRIRTRDLENATYLALPLEPQPLIYSLALHPYSRVRIVWALFILILVIKSKSVSRTSSMAVLV